MDALPPPGTWICYTYRGTLEYAEVVVEGEDLCLRVGPYPPTGVLVQRGVWKSGVFEPRGKPKAFLGTRSQYGLLSH